MNVPDLTVITAVASAAVGAAGWAVKKAWPVVRNLVAFVNDVTGEPARPGYDGRKGLMERVKGIEDTLERKQNAITDLTREVHQARSQQLEISADMAAVKKRIDESSADVAAVKAELTLNGGSSVKDAIVQIRRQVNALSAIPAQVARDT